MKTFLISIICFVMTLLSFAQKNTVKTEHMTFKGVPINGTLNEFVTKMKQSGFTLIGTENGVATLNGDFWRIKTVKLELQL